MQHKSFWASTTHSGFVWLTEEGESPKLSGFLIQILSVYQFYPRDYLAYFFFSSATGKLSAPGCNLETKYHLLQQNF